MAGDAENAIYAKLAADTDVTAIVGTSPVRVFHDMAREGMARPYVVLQRISTQHIENLQNSAGLALARTQVDCWADEKDDCDNLAEEVRKSLQGFAGTVNGIEIRVDGIDEERSLPEPPMAGRDRPIYRWSFDVMVWYGPTIPVHA